MDQMKSSETIVQTVSRRHLLRYTGLGLCGGLINAMISPRNAAAQEKGVHSIWVHGHSVQIENPQNIETIERQRFHSYILGKTTTQTWFHFAISTPVMVNGKQIRAKYVGLSFESEKEAIVQSIQVYDGQKRLAMHQNIGLAGGLFNERFDVIGYPRVEQGIGISVGVMFSRKAVIKLISAGCTFFEL